MSLNALGLGLLFTAKDMATPTMEKVSGGMKNTKEAASSLKETTEKVGAGFTKVGTLMVAAGAAGLAGLGVAVGASRDFGKAIALVASEADTSVFSVDAMKKVSLDLAQQFGKMPVEEAQALYDAVGFGATNAADATSSLTAANKLAIAGNTDVKTALSAVIGTLNSYNASYDKSADVSDAFFKAMTLGKTTVGELAAAMPSATGIAHNLGIEYETLLAATATLTKANVPAAEAVTGLKAAFANIMKPTKEASDEAKRLGISFDAATVRAKGFPDLLEEITHNSKFTDDTFTQLFGSVEAGNAVMQLTSGGMVAFNSNLEAMKSRGGATDAGFKGLAKTLQFSQDKFKSLVEVGKIMIGDVLAPLAARALDTASSIVAAFNKIPAPLREMIVKAAAAAAGIATLGGGISLIAGKLIPVIGTIAEFIGAGGLASIAEVAAPAIAAIAAITAVVAGFKIAIDENLGGIGDVFGGFFSGIKLSFQALVQLFTQGGFSGAVRDEFLKGENPFINFAIKVWLFVNKVQNFLEGFANGFKAAIEAAEPTFKKFADALKKLGAAFGLTSIDSEAAGKSFDEFGSAGESAGGKIGEVVTGIVDVMTMGIDIVTGFVEAWHEISPAIDEVMAAVGELLSPLGELISTFSSASAAGSEAHGTFAQVGHFLATTLAQAFHKAAGFIRDLASTFDTAITGIMGVVNIVSGILTGDWTRVWMGIRQVVYSSIAGVIDMFFAGVQAIADGIDELTGLIGIDTGAGAAVRAAKDNIKIALKDVLGIDQQNIGAIAQNFAATNTAQASVTSPPTASAETSSTSSPFLAQYGLPQSVFDPAQAEAAATAAASAAVSKVPPPAYSFTMVCDGEVLGRIASTNTPGQRPGDYSPVDISTE